MFFELYVPRRAIPSQRRSMQQRPAVPIRNERVREAMGAIADIDSKDLGEHDRQDIAVDTGLRLADRRLVDLTGR